MDKLFRRLTCSPGQSERRSRLLHLYGEMSGYRETRTFGVRGGFAPGDQGLQSTSDMNSRSALSRSGNRTGARKFERRSRPSRPSLRISRPEAGIATASFTFEVWNPFAASYQNVTSMQVGLLRLDYLAKLIGQMWLQRHRSMNALLDPPIPDDTKRAPWAEFRVNPGVFCSYDFRRSDRPAWVRADGKDHATEAICKRVGYARPMRAS
jgi:hypothetical protein